MRENSGIYFFKILFGLNFPIAIRYLGLKYQPITAPVCGQAIF
ncbi:hypothetical protein D1BOALGB6SA_4413 [Olavius sp. associated proteobacterium Delta 1]|nr:hypothetical protein D1BOALGB6SA_4413 [Olavius sp. associated proteobacterium Delta 1]